MAKSTNAEIEKRVKEITNLLLNGYSRLDIIQYSSKYKVSDRQIDTYIKKALEGFRENIKEDLKTNFSIHINQRYNLYKIAIKESNLKLALEILKDIAKLQGLYDNNIALEDKESSYQNIDIDSLSSKEITNTYLDMIKAN